MKDFTGVLRTQVQRSSRFFSIYSLPALSHEGTHERTGPPQFLLCRKLKHQMLQQTNNRNDIKEVNAHICYFITTVLTWVYFSLPYETGELSLAICKALMFYILSPLSISEPLTCRNVSRSDNKGQENK